MDEAEVTRRWLAVVVLAGWVDARSRCQVMECLVGSSLLSVFILEYVYESSFLDNGFISFCNLNNYFTVNLVSCRLHVLKNL